MRLKSRGLGRKELVMDFREYDVVREDDELVVVGTIRDPVNWEFSIRMCEDDITGITRLLLRKPMIMYLLRSLFRRTKHHHWTQERSEHIEEGQRRLATAKQKAADRIREHQEAQKAAEQPGAGAAAAGEASRSAARGA